MGFPVPLALMRIDILTLFPAMFQGPLTESIIDRARTKKLLQIEFHDLRTHGLGQYHQVDDSPYGGGAGMVMRPDALVPAIEAIAPPPSPPPPGGGGGARGFFFSTLQKADA